MNLNKEELNFCISGGVLLLLIWLACEIGWVWSLFLGVGCLCWLSNRAEDAEKKTRQQDYHRRRNRR